MSNKYIFSNDDLTILIDFLNRVTNYKNALKDVANMNRILTILQNPIKEESKDKEGDN